MNSWETSSWRACGSAREPTRACGKMWKRAGACGRVRQCLGARERARVDSSVRSVRERAGASECPERATPYANLWECVRACRSLRERARAYGSVQKWTGDGGSVREREGSCGSVRAVHENAGIYYGSVRGNPGRSTKKIPETFHQPIRMYMLKVIAVGVRRYSNLQDTRNDHH